MRNRNTLGLSTGALVLLLTACQPATAAEFNRHFSLDGGGLKLINLIGEIRLEGYGGDTFEIDVAVRGSDASPDLLTFDTKEGGQAVLTIRYPEEDTFVYPPMGAGSHTSFTIRGGDEEDDWLNLILPLMGKGKIKVAGRGSGLEAWADLTVKVPEGKDVNVRHGVGDIAAEGLEGRIVLDTVSGEVTARRIKGELVVDTGSGSVEASEVEGNVNADTGSGEVSLFQCAGETILVDTGSGSVEAEGIRCEHLNIDTGSGGVEVRASRIGGAKIDTGSGSVSVSMDEMGAGSFVIDTGSGSIDLCLPRNASVDLIAETGNGGIAWKLPDADVRSKQEDEVALRLGAGETQVRLDTGSGGIRIHH